MRSRARPHIALLNNIREGDLVRLTGGPGVYRVASLQHDGMFADLRHMSGKRAGSWDVGLIVPLATGEQNG